MEKLLIFLFENFIEKLFIFFIVCAFLLKPISCAFYQITTQDNVTIKEKERVHQSGNISYYLVWTEQDEVFQNSDAFWHFKWNSSDLYGEMKEGKTYNCIVYGWRIPILSMYRNIVTMETVE